jgi:hypothetical protein
MILFDYAVPEANIWTVIATCPIAIKNPIIVTTDFDMVTHLSQIP